MQKEKCGYKNPDCWFQMQYICSRQSHFCPSGKLQFLMNLQIFKLEGFVYALHTTFNFASEILTVKDLHNERSELCHISRFREKNVKF